jgi:hypothetical protein
MSAKRPCKCRDFPPADGACITAAPVGSVGGQKRESRNPAARSVRLCDEEFDERDEQLLAELRRIAQQIDPVPSWVTQAARAAFAWRSTDAELAELTYDSILDDGCLDAIRGGRKQRQLRFESTDLSVDIEVASVGCCRKILGQLTPCQVAPIDIRHAAGVTTVKSDELGRFTADGLPPGPASLRCRMGPTNTRIIDTSWIPL